MTHTIEFVTGSSKGALKGILDLEKNVYPEDWQFDDAEKYFGGILADPENINILLKKGDKIIGCAISTPHSKAFEELKEDDSQLRDLADCFYVVTFELASEIQKTLAGGRLFFRMLEKLIKESKIRGASKLTFHARVSTGFSDVLRRYFRNMVIEERRIDKWANYNRQESTDYFVIDFNKK